MRWKIIAAGVLLSLAAGCDGPEPVGEATASAVAASPSAIALPAAGMCHAGQSLGVYDYRPVTLNAVDCAAEHQAEIIRVGRLTTPPENKTREVFTDCDTAAREYVGGDWHEGRLGLAIIVPSTQEWIDGVREYRCALFEFFADGHSSRLRTGSLKDGLRGTRPLALTCVEVRATPDGQGWYKTIDHLVATDCAQPHNGEYIGLHTGPDVPHPGMTKLAREVTQVCNTKAATFLGESPSKFQNRTDLRVVMTGGIPDRWRLGDRTARCYILTRPDNRLTKSLKAGP
ncbi:septum formation family protein [Dactylosporangium sp. NPDC005555]|uniref:septum formation family protein n=1 Tax=Dactylosporangium sp. NPDC005555 TaxID=3154889 RepID=UPI0033B803D6